MSITSGKLPSKRSLINSLLEEIAAKKRLYHRKMCYYKKADDISEACIIGSGSIAASSLFITITTINPVALIVGTAFTSASTIGSAIKRVLNVTNKYEMCKTTYTQLADLERETRAVLVRNHLESKDLQNLLDDVNNRLSLIEDSALPISNK